MNHAPTPFLAYALRLIRMVLNSKALTNIPVRTKSGMAVGRFASLDLDADSGRLMAIRVRVPGVVPHLLDDEVIVQWAQIISISEDEVVISDASVPVGRWLAQGVSQHTT